MRDVISITKSIIKINAIPIRIGFINANESEAKKTGKIRHVYQEIFQIVQRNSFLKVWDSEILLFKNQAIHFTMRIANNTQKNTSNENITIEGVSSRFFSNSWETDGILCKAENKRIYNL